MSVCYFNNNYEKEYRCEYKIENGDFEVSVEYGIESEIKPVNGITILNAFTKYENRDVLVIDSQNKVNYLLKSAFYVGSSSIFGSPDSGEKTRFRTSAYFFHSDYNKLCDLPKEPKVKKIKVYSNLLIDMFGIPSLTIIDDVDEYLIKLNKNNLKKSVEINKNNIKTITIGDNWRSTKDNKKHIIEIKLSKYIEIELLKKAKYVEVVEYINELIMYMQLLIPDKFDLLETIVNINDEPYVFNFAIKNRSIKKYNVHTSVDIDIFSFLSRCYDLIPFRLGKSEVRNIPYIVLSSSRNIEDNYLMFYRFIESYYKRQPIKGISSNFINFSITNNYDDAIKMSTLDLSNLSQEIVSLRNHYVHSGYHLKNSSLRIKLKEAPVNTHKVSKVDFDWIHYRTDILYKIVINIIFKNMLGFDKYIFNRHF